MNIVNLLQLLTEGKNLISDIREKTQGKVPESVLNTLASLMKNDYYDNTAMAIIKKIQEWEEDDREAGQQNLEFLKKRPKLVYAALKESAKDNSDYNPERELNFFHFNTDDPMKFWAEFRSGEKKYKEESKNKKKEIIGFKGVEPIKLKDSYLFIPRSFKFDGRGFNGLRISDLDKQWEELKSLSMSMANKDTSGEVYGGDKATENHWCVASDNKQWFEGENYKGGHLKGIFVIIVNKNKDGSPNWNDRYLYWNNGYGITEVADKFNRHGKYNIHVPQETVDFIENKIVKKLKFPKADQQYSNLRDRVESAKYHSEYEYTKKGTKKVNTNSPTFKNYIKVLRFLRNAYQQTDGNNENEDLKTLIWQAIKNYGRLGRKAPAIHTKYYTVKVEPFTFGKGENGGGVYVKIWKTGNEEKVGQSWGISDLIFSIKNKDATEISKDINKLEPYLKKYSALVWQKYQNLKPSFKSKAYILYDATPPKEVKDILRNNKFALAMYDSDRMMDAFEDDEIREFFIGPYFSIVVRQGQNLVFVSPIPWDTNEEQTVSIGELNDHDILDKVKKAYQTYVEKKEN